MESDDSSYIKNKIRNYSEVARGLSPNTLYHFRLQTSGPKSSSMFSQPLVVMTIPERPSVPVLINISSNRALVKWYPGKGGCSKFRVESRYSTMSSSSSSMSWSEWTPVSCSQATLWAPTTLTPNRTYEVRIYALNYMGSPSEASETLVFKTKPRNERGADSGIPADIDAAYPANANDDICIGDTILLTENLYANEKDSQGNAERVCLGERTIAALVFRDNYRTIRSSKSSAKKGSTVKNAWDDVDSDETFTVNTSRRILGLEVVWERCSAACKPYANKPGDVIERSVANIEIFEVFRALWHDEAGRRPLKEEWSLLADCFHSPTSGSTV